MWVFSAVNIIAWCKEDPEQLLHNHCFLLSVGSDGCAASTSHLCSVESDAFPDTLAELDEQRIASFQFEQ